MDKNEYLALKEAQDMQVMHEMVEIPGRKKRMSSNPYFKAEERMIKERMVKNG